jgi:transposase-like protein
MDANFKSILDLVKAFPDEQTCIDHLTALRWDDNVVSPFDETSIVYKCAGNKYKCKNTGKYFNVKTGTIFEDTKIPLRKWFMALYVFSSHKKGISSHQLAKDIDVTQKTAWFVLHRLRYAFDHPEFQKSLSGHIEADETYMGGDEKNKHASKKIKGSQGRSLKTKTPVFDTMERGGNIIAHEVVNVKKKSLTE